MRAQTDIKQLAYDCILAIEASLPIKPTYFPTEALATLKAHQQDPDVILVLGFYEIFCALGKSVYFTPSMHLASFLYQAREIIVNEYNWITDCIAQRNISNKQSTTRKKVILENESALSLVDKRIILEENHKLMDMLEKLQTDLLIFKQMSPLTNFSKVNKDNMLNIFNSVWVKRNIAAITAIVTSKHANNNMHALCNKWDKYPFIIGGCEDPWAFMKKKIWETFNMVKLIASTSWFMAYIEPCVFINKLEHELFLCQESVPYHAEIFERIEFFLQKSMEKGEMDKTWLKEKISSKSYNAQNDAQLRQLLLKCYIDKYVSKNFFLFFGSRDPDNLLHLLPDDMKKVLQEKCLDVSIPVMSEMLQKFRENDEDDQPVNMQGLLWDNA